LNTDTTRLLPGTNWPHLLAAITEVVTDQSDPVVYQRDAKRRFTGTYII
jgi:hypothetical protein